MAWWKDQVWEQGIALVLVIIGAGLIWSGASQSGKLDVHAFWDAVLFSIGLALPIAAQLGLRQRLRPDRTDDI